MAKTSSFSHSNLSSLLRDHKKQMLSRDKLLLGCEAEANADLVGSELNELNELDELDEQELWEEEEEEEEDQHRQENYSMQTRSMESPAYGLASLSPLVSNIKIPQQNHHVVSSSAKVLLRQQSAPMNVPDWSKILGSSAKGSSIRNNNGFMDSEDEDERSNDPYEQRLPPHELVARDYARSHVMTFSVYEGTLKGRDLSRVRNAVLKQTGFL